MEIINKIKDHNFIAGIVTASGVKLSPSPQEFINLINNLVKIKSAEEFSPVIKEAIRKLLKVGGFKPTGRNKPASEYLAQAARENRFPIINNLVDINNYLSLKIGLPISLLDLDKTSQKVLLRCGKQGEKYIFNSAGQEIDLTGLISICKYDPYPGIPFGNPVKDSMEAKISDNTSSVIGIIYSSKEVCPKEIMQKHVNEFSELLKVYGHAAKTELFFTN